MAETDQDYITLYVKPLVDAAVRDVLAQINVQYLIDYLHTLQVGYDVANQANADLLARLTTQAGLIAQLTQLVHTIVGGETMAASMSELYTLMQQNIAGDQITGADFLAKYNTLNIAVNQLTTSVQLARSVADNAVATTQTQAVTLLDQGQKIAANTTEVAKRLLRTGDSATGAINVLSATAMEQAVRLGDLAGGLRRPYKIWINPGATPGPPDTDSSGGAAIVNPFPVPLAFAFRSILIRNVSASALAVQVKVYKSTDLVNPIYSQTLLATQVPAVSKAIDFLNVFATATPADLALPCTLLVSCSVPGYEIEINGVLKKP